MKFLVIIFLLVCSVSFAEERIRKEYNVASNPILIMETILTAHPDWNGTKNAEGVYENPLLYVESRTDKNKLWLTFPKSAEKEIDEIVAKHDPTQKARCQIKAEEEATKKALLDAKTKELATTELIKEGKLDAGGKVK